MKEVFNCAYEEGYFQEIGEDRQVWHLMAKSPVQKMQICRYALDDCRMVPKESDVKSFEKCGRIRGGKAILSKTKTQKVRICFELGTRFVVYGLMIKGFNDNGGIVTLSILL